jgi:hypothetical protein
MNDLLNRSRAVTGAAVYGLRGCGVLYAAFYAVLVGVAVPVWYTTISSVVSPGRLIPARAAEQPRPGIQAPRAGFILCLTSRCHAALPLGHDVSAEYETRLWTL